MSLNFSDYIISNYSQFVNDTNTSISNSLTLLDRIERNYYRIVRSVIDEQQLRRTDELIQQYNNSFS